jgi:hypothetical protein
MFKALAATLAPFADAEKPQLFPRPAASFIKNEPRLRGVRIGRVVHRTALSTHKRSVGVAVRPISIGFFIDAAQREPARHGRNLTSAAPVHRRNFTAHIDGRRDPAISICRNRHNFATGHSRFLATPGTTRAVPEAVAARKAGESRYPSLPKSWAKAGAFSLLTRKSKLAQY